ncbi:unnamed protein product [Dicrocoelium dendriticum]|nr:unnamed protein product [Dicrocoelium dendriticum]
MYGRTKLMIYLPAIFALAVCVMNTSAEDIYTDCSEQGNVISVTLKDCSAPPCNAQGGTTIPLAITFKSYGNVTSGKARMCMKVSGKEKCHKEVAEIDNFCDSTLDRCPLKTGDVQTYTTNFPFPDLALLTIATYELLDQNCQQITCVEIPIRIISENTDDTKFPSASANAPCSKLRNTI